MNTINENDRIILAVVRNENDLTIRIDQNSWASDSFEGLPVVELKLTGCRSAARLYDWEIYSENEPLDEVLAELTNWVDISLYYEVVKEADEFVISLQFNYTADGLTLYCTQISETPSDYTVEELKGKARKLAQLYLASDEAHRLSDSIYHLLRHKLSQMISKELDLYQSKIDFFSRTNPEEAATLRGEAQAYRKVLKLIGLGEVDGKPTAIQIKAWISQIWYEHLKDQAGHPKSFTNRITDLGEAALFPLLEMVEDPDPDLGYRKEAIYMLGLIDPAVKEMIVNILGSGHAE